MTRTLTEKFDEDLGEGVFVTIRNPRVLPLHMLQIDKAPDLDQHGRLADPKKAIAETDAFLAGFVLEWHVEDPLAEVDEPQLLGDPSADTMGRCPAPIRQWIYKQVQDATGPL